MSIRTSRAKSLILGLAMLPVIASCSQFSGDSGSAPTDARVSFAFGLQRDQDGLASFAKNVGLPKQSGFRKFISVPDVAARFGASTDESDRVMQHLKAAGFAGSVDATGGLAVGTFSVADAEQFFGVPLNTQTDPNGSRKIVPASELQVPDALRGQVSQVFGGRATVSASSSSSSPSSSSPSAGTTESADREPVCPDVPAIDHGIPESLGRLYGLNTFAKQGITGAGVRVGLLEIDTYSPKAVKLFEKCFEYELPPVNVVASNATREQLRQSNDEVSLDLVALGLVAPGLKEIDIIEFDGDSSVVFPLSTVMDRQKSESTAVDALAISIAFCATDLTDEEREMSEWLLMAAAATGLTTVSSSGDRGSSGCYPSDKSAGVQYPSESPYVVSVGGTEIEDITAPRPTARVWNESPSLNFASGGGPSVSFPRPDYQSVTGLSESQRQIPDMAFLASPLNAEPLAVCNPGMACEFKALAGTSAVAPAVAGAVALVTERLRKKGLASELGLLNGSIYYLASDEKTNSLFTDITEGTNDLFGTGCCDATAGYDMASGWGSVNFGDFSSAIESMSPQK